MTLPKHKKNVFEEIKTMYYLQEKLKLPKMPKKPRKY